PSQSPQPIPSVPPGSSTNGLNRREGIRRWHRDAYGPRIHETRAEACSTPRLGLTRRGESIGPTRLRKLPLFASKGSADCLLNSHRTNGERLERVVVADYRGVDDAFDELASDAGVQWRD